MKQTTYVNFIEKFYWLNILNFILVYSISFYPILRIHFLLKDILFYPFLLVFLFLLYLFFLSLTVGIIKIVFPKIIEGNFNILKTKKAISIWIFHAGYHNLVASTFLINIIHQTPFYKMYYRLQGLKCKGKFVLSRESDILDPYLVELGNNVLIGAGAFLTSHLINHNNIYLKKIIIGNNVTIGAHAKINPGVIIDEGSIIGENSVVMPDTHIKKNEFWAGSPAKKIKN